MKKDHNKNLATELVLCCCVIFSVCNILDSLFGMYSPVIWNFLCELPQFLIWFYLTNKLDFWHIKLYKLGHDDLILLKVIFFMTQPNFTQVTKYMENSAHRVGGKNNPFSNF